MPCASSRAPRASRSSSRTRQVCAHPPFSVHTVPLPSPPAVPHTPGSESYDAIRAHAYAGCQAVLIYFSLAAESTLDRVVSKVCFLFPLSFLSLSLSLSSQLCTHTH